MIFYIYPQQHWIIWSMATDMDNTRLSRDSCHKIKIISWTLDCSNFISHFCNLNYIIFVLYVNIFVRQDINIVLLGAITIITSKTSPKRGYSSFLWMTRKHLGIHYHCLWLNYWMFQIKSGYSWHQHCQKNLNHCSLMFVHWWSLGSVLSCP